MNLLQPVWCRLRLFATAAAVLLFAADSHAVFLITGTYYTTTVHDFNGDLLAEYSDDQLGHNLVPHYSRLEYVQRVDTVVGDMRSEAEIIANTGVNDRMVFSLRHDFFLNVGTFAEQSVAGNWSRITSEAGSSVLMQDSVTFSSHGQSGPGSLLMFWEVSGFHTVSGRSDDTQSDPALGLGYDIRSQVLLTMEDVLGTDVVFDETLPITSPPVLMGLDQVLNQGYEDEVVVGSATFMWNEPAEINLTFETFSDMIITSIDASQNFNAATFQHFGDTFELSRIELRNSSGELVTDFDAQSDLGVDYEHFAQVPEPSTNLIAGLMLLAALQRTVRSERRGSEVIQPMFCGLPDCGR